jgi:hypothetical protein
MTMILVIKVRPSYSGDSGILRLFLIHFSICALAGIHAGSIPANCVATTQKGCVPYVFVFLYVHNLTHLDRGGGLAPSPAADAAAAAHASSLSAQNASKTAGPSTATKRSRAATGTYIPSSRRTLDTTPHRCFDVPTTAGASSTSSTSGRGKTTKKKAKTAAVRLPAADDEDDDLRVVPHI